MSSDSEAEERVTMTVEACLGRTIEGIDWIPAGLGLRRFARVHLAGDSAPVSVIARVEAPEDPAGRPPGLPPAPPLEPLRALLERGLIKVVGHQNVPGHPRLYGTTRLFLQHFGLKSLKDLPKVHELTPP